ncbi:hypothetical protein LIA77_10283 [Sarocladium implicatum]|nr:hypothetical protein LIA77_10283 [Sarocladium implicatum]
MTIKSAILLLAFADVALSQTVTIQKDIPPREHDCIEDCLFRPYNRDVDVGDVLECAPPYEESCYCPSDDSQAEIVSRHLDSCASESCSRGDLSQDVDKMRAHYATYCIEKGYTADLVEEWYSALETVASTTSDEEMTTTTTTETETEESTAASTTAPESSERTTSSDVPTSTTAADDGDDESEEDGEGGRDLPDLDDGGFTVTPGRLLLGVAPIVILGFVM